MLVLHTLQQVTGDKQLDPFSCRSLCWSTEGSGVIRSQEANPCSELDTVTYPVSALDSHGNTVVELQSGDVAEPQHDARSVRPADTFSQLLKVRPGAVAIVEVAEVARVKEEVRSEKVSEAALARSEGQRSVEVEAAGPVCLSTQIVTFTLRPDSVHPEPSHTGGTSEVEPVSDAGRLSSDGTKHPPPQRRRQDRVPEEPSVELQLKILLQEAGVSSCVPSQFLVDPE